MATKETNRICRAVRYACTVGGPRRLGGVWELLSKARKRYARYLVERYGYPVRLAIQHAYVFGFDAWPYDYRADTCVREERSARSFGF